MRKIQLLAGMILIFFATCVSAADISGSWTVTMQNPQGSEESFELNLQAAGEALTITGTHPGIAAMTGGGGTLTGSGTLKGSDITMNFTETTVGVQFAFTGKVAGNKMSGTREVVVAGPGGGQGAAGGDAQGPPAGGGDVQGPPAGGGDAQGPPSGGGPGGGPGEGGGQGAPPSGDQGASAGEVSNAWTAVKN